MSEEQSDFKSTAERLLAQREKDDERYGIEEARYEEYKKALNIMADTPAGKLVLQTWIKAMGVFDVKPTRDGLALVKDKALRDFYLTMIRLPMDKELRQNLEP